MTQKAMWCLARDSVTLPQLRHLVVGSFWTTFSGFRGQDELGVQMDDEELSAMLEKAWSPAFNGR